MKRQTNDSGPGRRWTIRTGHDIEGTDHTVVTPDNEYHRSFRTRAQAEAYISRRNRR